MRNISIACGSRETFMQISVYPASDDLLFCLAQYGVDIKLYP